MRITHIRSALAASSALFLTITPVLAADTPVQESDLRRHMTVLASDAFEGRAPGTDGEMRTLAYLISEWAAAGLVSGSNSDTPWLQAVPLVETRAISSTARFHHGGRTVAVEADDVLLAGAKGDAVLSDLPLVFAGYGVNDKGEVVGDVAGKAVLLFVDNAPFGDAAMGYRARRTALAAAGAKAVIGIPGISRPWAALRAASIVPTSTLAGSGKGTGADITGYLSLAGASAVLTAAGLNSDNVYADAKNPAFVPIAMTVRADLSAKTEVRPFTSHNVIGKIAGKKPDGKALLMLGHWDHLGICRPEGAADRICNGAVDNASGMAVLIEVAKRLAQGERPDRDIYVMGTTAEERGLLGATYFADHPVVPLDSLIAALNVDTIAISGRGVPVATIGRGDPALDKAIADTAIALGRTVDSDGEADAFVQRQDGWALAAKGVKALMIGGSFSDMPKLQAFLGSDYHGPADAMSDAIPLGGAAEDADLHVALARKLASTSAWPVAK